MVIKFSAKMFCLKNFPQEGRQACCFINNMSNSRNLVKYVCLRLKTLNVMLQLSVH